MLSSDSFSLESLLEDSDTSEKEDLLPFDSGSIIALCHFPALTFSFFTVVFVAFYTLYVFLFFTF